MNATNSSGETLYKDCNGIKRNLRGMLREEPEWVVSRFSAIEAEVARLRGIIIRAWIQCEREGKPAMCWDTFHELQREAAAAGAGGSCQYCGRSCSGDACEPCVDRVARGLL